MEDWRCDVSNNGFCVADGGPRLIDLSFSDERWLFGGFADQFGYKLVTPLWKVGVKPDVSRTTALATKAQRPKTLPSLVWRFKWWTTHRPIMVCL